MTLEDYITACKSFAADTEDWYSLEPGQFYVANGSDWEETCDNAIGGIDLKWAFHEEDGYIEREAPVQFCYELTQELRQGLDEDFDADQWAAVAKRYV